MMQMTKTIKTTSVLVTLSLALLSTSSALAANTEVGVNAAVKGDVTIQSGEQRAKQAVVKKPVLLGDVVNSNKVGSLQVLLKDQTMFTVGPECNLTIDKFVYDPDKDSNALSASVKKGMFRFMSGNISKSGPDSVTIETPIASMGVRGTMVEGLIGAEAIDMARNAGAIAPSAKVDPVNASLFILRGPGKRNSSKNKRGEIAITSGGETVTVKKSGMAIFVADKNAPPSKPFIVLKADLDKFHDKLRTEPTSQTSYKPFTIDAGLSPSVGQSTPNPNASFLNPLTDLQRPADFDSSDDFTAGCTPFSPHFPGCQGDLQTR